MTILTHYTITTGHMARVPRAEGMDRAVSKLLPAVRAGAGNMGVPGWHLSIVHRMDGGAVWQIGPAHRPDAPWTICVTCWRPDISGQAWSNLMALAKAMGLPGGAAPIVDVPWMATILTGSMEGLGLQDVMMMGDAGQCVSWTLIAQAEEQANDP
jgi:hypothetical protein